MRKSRNRQGSHQTVSKGYPDTQLSHEYTIPPDETVGSSGSSSNNNNYSLTADPHCLWRFILVLTLDRYYRLTDTEIAQQHDRMKHPVLSQGIKKLLLELGHIQQSVTENVTQLQEKKKRAKEIFIHNLELLSAGCQSLPLVDNRTTIAELEKMVAYYSSSDLSSDEDTCMECPGGAVGDSCMECPECVGSELNIEGDWLSTSDITHHNVDGISNVEYVVGLLQPENPELSNAISAVTQSSQSAHLSVMYNDPAIVSVTPEHSHPSAVSTTTIGDESTAVDPDETDADGWETVTNKRNKMASSPSRQHTPSSDPAENRKWNGKPAAKRKTAMCRLNEEGRCNWGDNCNYAHSKAELASQSGDRQLSGMVVENSCLKSTSSKNNIVLDDPTPAGNIKFKGCSQRRKTEMCQNFELGKCNWGEKCNYAHSAEELKAAVDSPSSALLHSQSNSAYNTILKMENPTPSGNRKFKGADGEKRRKTEMCQNFELGKCSWGEKCNYAHSAEELLDNNTTCSGYTAHPDNTKPNTATTTQTTATNSTIGKKLLMCINYSGGNCKWPANVCKYAHHADELDARFNHSEPCTNQQCAGRLRYERRRTSLCVPENGRCKFGSTCTYAHSEEELRLLPKHEMCHRYAAGRCVSTEDCVYAHSEVELRPMSPSHASHCS